MTIQALSHLETVNSPLVDDVAGLHAVRDGRLRRTRNVKVSLLTLPRRPALLLSSARAVPGVLVASEVTGRL
jgi:hypothetical protein